MGSRIKENPQKIFDLFFEAACPMPGEDDPQVLRQFPAEFDGQESIQMLPRFCFPFDIERVKETPKVQHFTFALTDMEGKQRFGFCRLAMGFRTCLCILSYLPWYEVFYKILNITADHLAKKQFNELDEFLSTLYVHPVPERNSTITLAFLIGRPCYFQVTTSRASSVMWWNEVMKSWWEVPLQTASYFIAPGHGKLPTIPENRNLTEFVVAVAVSNMLQLYASLLHERRILLTTSKLNMLTACVQASSTMLYPMHWQHIYIPVLPSHLLDYCCAPMPYLIGVHSSFMERVRSKALEDVVILNIDSNTLESPFQDLENLPSDIVSLLKFQLKKQSAATGDGVARAFLRAQALLFGSYRDALIYSPGQSISFCQATFLKQGSGTMQAFLQQAVHLQLFKQFIEDRLERLNTGEDFSDLFEQEISRSLSPGNMHAYQLWVENLKKGGGALISTVKTKANPAVRSAYQYAKGQAKMGLKGMRSRWMEKDTNTDQDRLRGHSLHCDHISSPNLSTRSSQSENLQNRMPVTQHFGKSRPRRPQRQSSRTDLQAQSTASLDCPLESDTFSDGDDDLQAGFLGPGGLDLLGEIFETLSLLEPSQAERPLYGTRSLDFSNLEDRSFRTKLRPNKETIHEPVSEEYDDSDSLLKGTRLLPSLEQETAQSASQLSATAAFGGRDTWDLAICEAQELPGPNPPAIPWQEEEEPVASAGRDLSPEARTQTTDHKASSPTENGLESYTATAEGQEPRFDQPLDPLPATSCSSSQSSVASCQAKANLPTGIMAIKRVPFPTQITPPQCPAVSRTLTQRRVSELKKRFEA